MKMFTIILMIIACPIGLAALVSACGSNLTNDATTAANQADVAAYAAELLRCTALAATAQEARDCQKDVRLRWCGPGGTLYNLGACSIDAGGE